MHGSIAFGEGCIVHPAAYIDARGGPITFGEYNILEEKTRIVNKVRGKDDKGNPILKEMKIGSYNLFETGCTVSTSEIGDYNEFSLKCFIEDNCRVGNNNYIGPRVALQVGSRLGDNKLVYEEDKILVNDDDTCV